MYRINKECSVDWLHERKLFNENKHKHLFAYTEKGMMGNGYCRCTSQLDLTESQLGPEVRDL